MTLQMVFNHGNSNCAVSASFIFIISSNAVKIYCDKKTKKFDNILTQLRLMGDTQS